MSLRGFTSHSFEQLARALAVRILGHGVTVFGRGPDGGREACFRGPVSFPASPASFWDGYGVVQAKFKDRVEDTQTEQRWAERQLTVELARWAHRTQKPQYYIFVTNVELTSAENGGRERLEAILNNHTPPLKGWRIWDGHQISTFIDTDSEIRTRFSHHLSAGDIVSEFARALKNQPSPESTLISFLSRELLADREARLSQAGHRGEELTSLSEVFLDLPVADAPTPPPFSAPIFALATLMSASERKLDPLSQQEIPEGEQAVERHPKYVFLGGPGSGKSTLGQQAAQLLRAALLDRVPKHRLEARVRSAIEELRSHSLRDSVHWPRTPRYPIRIELRQFARYLASTTPKATLSDYIRWKLSNGNYSISHQDLRGLLAKMPWMLILDGLDEVPASSNRLDVLSAISDFAIECRDIESDMLVVASSRPDGYSNEFADNEALQLYLQPLTPKLAIKCAEKYISAKFPGNVQRAEEAMRTLRASLASPLISNLMRSPLQVTFMVTVVAASGKPSESRWQLFGDYYRIIYDRELQKAVAPFDKVLSERRQDIDALHYRVGFLLQQRADESGGTGSELSGEDFRVLVRDCLSENGLSEHDLNELVELLLAASQQRLVFLTSRTPNRISFDVRSLQEFMAANCIMSDDSENVILRLRRIASSSAWRNTALFVVGGLFSEARFRFRRDAVRTICVDMNLEAIELREMMPGSRFALSILNSGTTLGVPLATRALAECALLLIGAPTLEGSRIQDLADAYSDDLRMEYEAAIRLHLFRAPLQDTVQSWLLLMALADRAVDWAKVLSKDGWPLAREQSGEILEPWLLHMQEHRRHVFLSDFHRAALLDAVRAKGPGEGSRLIRGGGLLDRGADLGHALNWIGRERRIGRALLIEGKECGLMVNLHRLPTDEDFALLNLAIGEIAQGAQAEAWSFLHPLKEYYSLPTVDSFTATLEHIKNSVPESDYEDVGLLLPWPMTACLRMARTTAELDQICSRVRAGEFGTPEAWRSQEQTFSESEEVSALFAAKSGCALRMSAGQGGVSVTTNLDTEVASAGLKTIIDHFTCIEDDSVRRASSDILFYGETNDAFGHAGPQSVEKVLWLFADPRRRSGFQLSANVFRTDVLRWTTICERVGRQIDFESEFVFSDDARSAASDLAILINDPTENWGCLLLSALWAGGGAPVFKVNEQILAARGHPDFKVRLAVRVLQLASNEGGKSLQLVDEICELAKQNPQSVAFELLCGVLEESGQLELIESAIRRLGPIASNQSPWRRERLRRLALRLIQSRPTRIRKTMEMFFPTKSLLDVSM